MTMTRENTTAPVITTAEDLLAKLRAGIKETFDIRMRELTVPVRILSIDEVNAIRREAKNSVAKFQGDDVDRNVEVQKSTLKLASTLTKGSGPLLSDKLLSLLSIDEIGYLYAEYIRVMDIVNPSLETIPTEVFQIIVQALKKNSITAKDLSLHQLKAICSAYQDLIQRLDTQTSPTDNSSGGPQSE